MPYTGLTCLPLDSYEEIFELVSNPPAWRSLGRELTPHSALKVRNWELCPNVEQVCLESPQPFCHVVDEDTPVPRCNARDVPKTLVCHDMANGYHDDAFVDGTSVWDAYTFYNWAGVDIFCYFSHHLVTIPPLGWINTAHRHGVKVIGTLITEWSEGIDFWARALESDESIQELASALAAIAKALKFEGWLLNVENKISQPDRLLIFVQTLHTCLHAAVKDAELIWYDSVTINGDLDWQNKLNDNNRAFFEACDGLFTNYSWSPNDVKTSAAAAGDRRHDLYIGVDVWGRNFFGGGMFNTQAALKIVHAAQCSLALFAVAWTHEALEADPLVPMSAHAQWMLRDRALWGSLWPFLCTRLPCQLPFSTSFCRGQGPQRRTRGEVLSPGPWYNIRHQQYQPMATHGPHGYLLAPQDRTPSDYSGLVRLRSHPTRLGQDVSETDSQNSIKDTKPDSEKTKPDTENTKPDSDKTKPDSENTKPDSDKTKPKSDMTKPDSDKTKPKSDKTKHGFEKTKPDTDKTKPDSGKTKSNSDKTKPNSENTKPESESTKPESESTKPKSESIKPESESSKPDSNKPKPDKTKPDSEKLDSESKHNSKDTKFKFENTKPKSDITKLNFDTKKSNPELTSPKSQNSLGLTINEMSEDDEGHNESMQAVANTTQIRQRRDSIHSSAVHAKREGPMKNSVSDDKSSEVPSTQAPERNVIARVRSCIRAALRPLSSCAENCAASSAPAIEQGPPINILSSGKSMQQMPVTLQLGTERHKIALALVRHERECLELCLDDAFTGGGCLRVHPSDPLNPQHRLIRLFLCDFPATPAVVLIIVTKVDRPFNMYQYLNVHLTTPQGKQVLVGRTAPPGAPPKSTHYPISPTSSAFNNLRRHMLLHQPDFYVPTDNEFGWDVRYYGVRGLSHISEINLRTGLLSGSILLGYFGITNVPNEVLNDS